MNLERVENSAPLDVVAAIIAAVRTSPSMAARGRFGMRCIFITVALLFAWLGSASAETVEIETVGQFLLSMPARSLDPIIDHCSENVPEIKNDLLNEKAGFIDKLTEAGKPLRDKLKDDPKFNAPVEESMRQEVANATSHALSILKQQDPDMTCRTILANIQGATADTLRKSVEDTYQKFRGAAQIKSSE